MLALTGYTDRFSAPPGGRIAFRISSAFEEDYQVDLVRIIHGDPNPEGPGIKLRPVASAIEGPHPSRYQPVQLGSCAEIPLATMPAGLAGGGTVGAVIWPTLPDRGPQTVVSVRDPATGGGFWLSIGPDGAGIDVASDTGETVSASTGTPLVRHQWYRVWACIDPDAGLITVHQDPVEPRFMCDDAGSGSVSFDGKTGGERAPSLLIAARAGRTRDQHFNGKIEAPFLLASTDRQTVAAVFAGDAPAALVARWDFGRAITTRRVEDTGPNGLHGTLLNLPSRAMTGSGWDGSEMCFANRPEHYGAIHFHEDDLHDCEWEDDFVFEVPDDMPSGIYGCRLRCRHVEDMIPFYVRPHTGRPTSDVVFLASTFTYQVYANHRRDNTDHKFREKGVRWGASQHLPDDHSDYAHSTYNFHVDGSGVAYSSRLRPIMTMRPNFLTFDDPFGSGMRHLPADTHLIDWLDAMGHGVDIVTDEDLDDEGVELIAPYRVVITGSHPEYHTSGTLDALYEYAHRRGGRLMYMGGNGFYWRVARNAEWPGALEIRRAENGIRTWAAEPGEYYNAFDASYGGLWRRNGRPPQLLAGVGFSSQGAFEGSYYRRAPGSDDPRVSWILEGINEEILGNFGLSGGGAAGFELDRADVLLGTPEHAVVIASSENHQPSFIPVLEDQLSQRNTYTGVPHASLIRSDIVFFETANGGAVFSVGSITFCGSLSHQNYANSISRMIDNVLRRLRAD